MTDAAALLRAYDDQLRTDAETANAVFASRRGPLRLAVFAGGYGFVSYRDLEGFDAAAIDGLVGDALAQFEADPAVTAVEWKTRAHDRAPGLIESLLAHGFAAEEPESIMIGEAALLVADVRLPDGVVVRRALDERDVRAMSAMQDEVFGDPVSIERADDLVQRLDGDDGTELWIAEVDGVIVSAGRLQPVEGSEFAGIWGGATREEWRGRGIYRALTAARARSALALGKRYINSDSTEFSRPILERSGLVKVSMTTPYIWRR
ncbi:GNAT family N-acetyltransferase [Agromyces endophyticus]|uniref:GNAT family N-acetyltransferase n=1 Tax=Agromyces sp. H17E-10 TaxID=2932244 RepID=UPI001FD0CB3F|nr:GNAT family N-acetyltransferase [Agromyces sp. H17E-10]UOQ88600.1 GNAT family N-acetyltransferase [Agromyces sp. H17E-10]